MLLGLAACGRLDFVPREDAGAGIVAIASAVGTNGAGAPTVSTPPQTYAAGDLLVAMVHDGDSSVNVTAVTDSAGNAFTFAPNSRLQIVGQGIQTVEIWYAHDIASSLDDIVTATLSGSSSSARIVVREYRGADPVAPFDVAATGSMLGTTTVTSDSFTTSTAGNVTLAFGVPQDTGMVVKGTGTWTAGAGYTLRDHEPTRDLQCEERFDTPSGAQTASLTYSQPGNMIISVASFKASGAF